MKSQADVVVVGAGPAGSFAGLSIAKRGVEVVICEEHEEVGLPSHCAGHVSIKGLDQLRLHVPERIIENKISGAVFYSPCGNEFRARFPSPVTYVINRTMFDKHLAELAEKAGAKLSLGKRAEKLLLNKGAIEGIALKDSSQINSKIVIDAEGCASTLIKQAGLRAFDRSMVVNAVNGRVDRADNLEDDTVEVYLGQKFAAGLYAWIIPRRDGSAKVGLATRTGNAREHLKHFLNSHPKAREKLRFNDVNSLTYHLIPLGGPIPKAYHNGFMAVGDAASHVKPTTGGGVVMGLTCARIAGETAAEAVKANNVSAHFLSDYHRRCQQTIGFDMRVMRRIRLMLNRLSDEKLDNIISLSAQLHLDEKLQELRDIDFQGRAILPLLRSPSAWAFILYSLLASL